MAQQVIARQSACARSPATGPWLWSQHWLDLFFAHWPVRVTDLRRHVPAALDIDTWEGSAWVSLVAFRLEGIRRRWLPSAGFLTNSLELNLRTYVRYRGEPAICFLSIHAGKRLLVRLARWATPLSYEFARMSYDWRDGLAAFHAHRPGDNGDLTFAASFTPLAGASQARAGSLDDWLLERYCLYAQDQKGTLFRTVVEHPPWAVQAVTAEVTANTMGPPFEIAVASGPAVVHYSKGVRAFIWPFSAVRTKDRHDSECRNPVCPTRAV
jgi:uncharacterized protein YqjF (DUF2071 family)